MSSCNVSNDRYDDDVKLYNGAFLHGRKWPQHSHHDFTMSTMPDFSNGDLDIVLRLITAQKSRVIARYDVLRRYYNGDNDINYKDRKTDPTLADNRIPSYFANHISTFLSGYTLGKPVTYSNDDDTTIALINSMSKENDDTTHNVRIKTDLIMYGRAYELLYVTKDESGKAQVEYARIAPEQAFVVYDTSPKPQSLFGVRFFGDDLEDHIVVYTDTEIFNFSRNKETSNDDFALVSESPHYFGAVPLNEYHNNDQNRGDYESILPLIDAYDLSQSELANFEQDSNNALLLITGQPLGAMGDDYIPSDTQTDKDGNPVMVKNPNGGLAMTQRMKLARVLLLGGKMSDSDPDPDAKYLVKTYDTAGSEAYMNRLVRDMLRFTLVPDVTDESFAGNSSGVAMRYKLIGVDNLDASRNGLFVAGLTRRLRLAATIWKVSDGVDYDKINDTVITLTPNIPEDIDSTLSAISTLSSSTDTSKQTLAELAAQITGVSASDEIKRIADEAEAFKQESASDSGEN